MTSDSDGRLAADPQGVASSPDATVLTSRHGALLHLVLNRPAKRNALNQEMVRLIVRAIAELDGDPECRAVVISGAGDNFSAGVDLIEAESISGVSNAVIWLQSIRRVFAAIRECPLPTVVGVEGLAVGGGFELAICSDFVVAGRRARFGLPEVQVGAIPSGGGIARLPHLIGLGRAKQMVLAGTEITGTTARDWGLVAELVDDGQATSAALALGERLSRRPAAVARLAKLALQTGSETDGATADIVELLATAAAFGTEDRIEGMRAFAEKRPPEFTHR